MRVAVYTIALNEEQFVQRWFDSAKDADYLFIADTGSTDKTVELARSLGIQVQTISVKPWRFDVARNASLVLLPNDIDFCVQLDMDEVLRPGWRQELEKAYEAKATRVSYEYIWSFNSDGTPGYTFSASKIHARQGYVWRNAAHELVYPDRITESFYKSELVIEHHPDQTKSRSQYHELLEVDAKENPYSDRSAFYLAREYFFQNMPEKAIAEFKRFLGLQSSWWAPERATAMRYLAKLEPDIAEVWLRLAIEQAPGRREALVDLSDVLRLQSRWQESLDFALQALAITEKPMEYANEADAWGYKPFDLAALANFYLGNLVEAVRYGQKALDVAVPEQLERLKANMAYYVGEK